MPQLIDKSFSYAYRQSYCNYAMLFGKMSTYKFTPLKPGKHKAKFLLIELIMKSLNLSLVSVILGYMLLKRAEMRSETMRTVKLHIGIAADLLV